MIPFDRFGRPIYSKLYVRLFNIGMKLKRLGYKESVRFPNLFVKALSGIVFFADLRGTELVPIWERPGVFFYFKGDRLKSKKVIVDEWISLNEKGCNPSIALSEEDEEGYLLDQCGYQLVQSYCSECSKEFFVCEGSRYAQCSIECQKKATKRLLKKKREEMEFLAEKIVCTCCRRHPTIELSSKFGVDFSLECFDEHHICYELDQTVLVCKQCHGKITRRQKGFEYFFPVDSHNQLSQKVLSFISKKKDMPYFRGITSEDLKSLKTIQDRKLKELEAFDKALKKWLGV